MAFVILGIVMIFLALVVVILYLVWYMKRANRQPYSTIKYPNQFPPKQSFKRDPTSSVLVFADMPQSAYEFSIRKSQGISLETAKQLASEIFDNPEGSFIGFEEHKRILQFIKEEGDIVTVDVPDVNKGGSYQTTVYNTSDIHQMLTTFYQGDSVVLEYDLPFIKQ